MTMDYSHLAARIKEYRMNKGLSQEALADKSGLSHRTRGIGSSPGRAN